MQLQIKSGAASMPLPISASDIVSFTPSHYKDTTRAPVYSLRVPTFRSRADVERETMGVALQIASESDLNAEAIAAVKAVVIEADQAPALDILGAYAAMLEGPPPAEDEDKAPREALARQAKDIHIQMSAHWPALQTKIKDQIFGINILNYAFARRHCAGWTCVGPTAALTPVTGADGLVTDACFGKLPSRDIIAIAVKAHGLGTPDKDTEKNSAGPSA